MQLQTVKAEVQLSRNGHILEMYIVIEYIKQTIWRDNSQSGESNYIVTTFEKTSDIVITLHKYFW